LMGSGLERVWGWCGGRGRNEVKREREMRERRGKGDR